MVNSMTHAKQDPLRDCVDVDALLNELSVSDRQIELAAGGGTLGGGGSSNPGVNCTGGCN